MEGSVITLEACEEEKEHGDGGGGRQSAMTGSRELIPAISSLSWFTTVVPLILVLAVSAAKDAIDDVNRHRSDKQVNNRPVKVLVNGRVFNLRLSDGLLLFVSSSLKEDLWLNVEVGDIVKLENNNFVTADLLLLSSSEPHSLTYIETAELDGETNLKVKQALTITAELGEDLQALSSFDGEVRCEAPNNKLDKFTGTLVFKRQKYPLDNEKMLLRGCTIRNTDWCFGLVIFAGETLSCFVSFLSLFLVTVLGLSVEIIRLCNSFYIDWDRKMYYAPSDMPAQARTTTLNEELGQIKYIFSDKTGTLTQNIMVFNKCCINGISYGDILDSEGHRVEITESTSKVDFSHNPLADPKFVFYDNSLLEAVKRGDTATHKFFRLLSLCHTVMPEEKKKGEMEDAIAPVGVLVYQAQSPDEGALVTAARNFGFVFRARTPETITVVEMGETVVYELLAILDFNNVRKRMSVIVRSPTGKLTLYCKGADTILYELLHPSCGRLKEETTIHLDVGEGLRTLVVAYRNLEESYFEDWQRRHYEASIALDNREEKLSLLYEEIEKDLMVWRVQNKAQMPRDWPERCRQGGLDLLERRGPCEQSHRDIATTRGPGPKAPPPPTFWFDWLIQEPMGDQLTVGAAEDWGGWLLGATAIEDKLQDGVPQTIEILGKANIKIWVLTGDKQETAVNIGYSCNMLYDAMKDIFIIQGKTSAEVQQELRKARKKMNPEAFADDEELDILVRKPGGGSKVLLDEEPNGEYGLVINGYSLAHALEGPLKLELVRTACLCKVVICCRVTPLQKAQVVELVKRHKDAVTLAVGEETAAHIGVGISGQEGMQAVLSSDYSFAQFRYLQRLLLVHGRWSYLRMCKFLAYFFYKNFTFTLVHFWYGFFSGFSAQDVDDRWSLQFPQLYEPGQQNLYFNKMEFVKCTLYSVYSSLVLFFVPYGTMFNSLRTDGKSLSDYQSFALMAQTCLLIVVSVQMGLDTGYWTAVNQLFIWGSLVVYFIITFTMYSNGTYLIFTASFPFVGTARSTLNQPDVWLAVALCVALCVLPVVAFRFLKTELRPTIGDKVAVGPGLRDTAGPCIWGSGGKGSGPPPPSAALTQAPPEARFIPPLRLRFLTPVWLRGPHHLWAQHAATIPLQHLWLLLAQFIPAPQVMPMKRKRRRNSSNEDQPDQGQKEGHTVPWGGAPFHGRTSSGPHCWDYAEEGSSHSARGLDRTLLGTARNRLPRQSRAPNLAHMAHPPRIPPGQIGNGPSGQMDRPLS
ncbi:hypothetical protein JD844_008045 [Phrynosoma platyrhinos]|uniref:P-type ATPase C-terminal domain-containing protein n=1 Tax=Phrynosoma platyrhinos TaxID=52577 RepID=A0ABQ7TEB7_PHRPL|nr:hypothetical protein JD844_008045 [Phrynosoma platyrhinos]